VWVDQNRKKHPINIIWYDKLKTLPREERDRILYSDDEDRGGEGIPTPIRLIDMDLSGYRNWGGEIKSGFGKIPRSQQQWIYDIYFNINKEYNRITTVYCPRCDARINGGKNRSLNYYFVGGTMLCARCKSPIMAQKMLILDEGIEVI
jgi:hypothetical protein